MPSIVNRSLVGYVPGVASPTDDPSRLGRASLSPAGPFVARSFASLAVTYTVGHHGMDDQSALKLVFRFPADWGELQLTDPVAPNYVTAEASHGVPLRLRYEGFGGDRPWFKELILKVAGGCLREGDEVVIRLGDPRQGSPGLKMQTFCEDAWELRLLVDPCATGHFVEVLDTLAAAIVPGPPERWKAVLPTRREAGQPFSLGVVAEDRWGNPSDQVDRAVQLLASQPVEGLPEHVHFPAGQRALCFEGLRAGPGLLRIRVIGEGGELLAESNPLRVGEGASYWGDLHGQTGETVGVNTAESYFRFARELAFLDMTSHQGNDFQINRRFWERLNELTQRFEEPGRFLAIPGYEWSGNTGVGGDRNVYFRREGAMIRRSSSALLTDRSDSATDLTTAAALFEALAGEDAVAYAHVGGRWADIQLAHDGRVERSVEIHSAWGTFEWLLHDAFDLGYRVGVVANSDGHKGRPGASYPGASTFGAYGGLTCFSLPELTRDALFEALRRRRHYATTGDRLDLEVRVHTDTPAEVYADDPRLGPCSSRRAQQVEMGEVARVGDAAVVVAVRVAAASPVERVELRAGKEVLQTWRPYGPAELGQRVRVVWQGANYRGRGRQVRWDGSAVFTGARIQRASRFNSWNPEQRFEVSPEGVRWEAVTTGNFGGCDLWLDGLEGELSLVTPLVKATVPLAAIGLEPTRLDGGGLERALCLSRLPEELTAREVHFRTSAPVAEQGDTPLWVCVTLESGHQAWSSPIYLTREPA